MASGTGREFVFAGGGIARGVGAAEHGANHRHGEETPSYAFFHLALSVSLRSAIANYDQFVVL
jgi:hypothetical protein